MSSEIRNKIAYWFFLASGIVGVIIFSYDYYNTDDYTFLEWLSIVSAFSVFIFKPTILVDVFNIVKSKLN